MPKEQKLISCPVCMNRSSKEAWEHTSRVERGLYDLDFEDFVELDSDKLYDYLESIEYCEEEEMESELEVLDRENLFFYCPNCRKKSYFIGLLENERKVTEFKNRLVRLLYSMEDSYLEETPPILLLKGNRNYYFRVSFDKTPNLGGGSDLQFVLVPMNEEGENIAYKGCLMFANPTALQAADALMEWAGVHEVLKNHFVS